MTWMQRRLSLALAFSLLLHCLPFVAPLLGGGGQAPKRQAPLEAFLKPLPAPPTPEQPPLRLPKPPSSEKHQIQEGPRKSVNQPPAKAPARENWTTAVKRQLKELDRQGKFYPEEAIARGLEGEAIVLLILDEAGNAVAARIEQSSGHRILDEAALRAVRSLKTLPASAPRETLIPVRFLLR